MILIYVCILIIVVLICILKSSDKQKSNQRSNNKQDVQNDSVITLAEIVVKIASKHLESGLFSINEQYGEYIAIFNHIDTYQMEGVLSGYIGLTPSEISFLTSLSQIERNTATIRIEIGRSDTTYKAVMNLITENKNEFSGTKTEDGYYDVYFR